MHNSASNGIEERPRHDVYPILFKQYRVNTSEANDYLPHVCRDHLILPGRPGGRIWKTLRVVARNFSRNLDTPRIIEEYNRATVKKRISAFLLSNQLDLFVFSKLRTVHLFGYEAIARLGRPCFLGLHDDSIEEERVKAQGDSETGPGTAYMVGPAKPAFLVGIACYRRGSGWPAACVSYPPGNYMGNIIPWGRGNVLRWPFHQAA